MHSVGVLFAALIKITTISVAWQNNLAFCICAYKNLSLKTQQPLLHHCVIVPELSDSILSFEAKIMEGTESFTLKKIKCARSETFLFETSCLSFWSISRATFHTPWGRVPPQWRSSVWSKPSCTSMCTVSRTALVLLNQHFKADLSIIRPLGAFAHAFHFFGPCWVNTETVCSWHHLSLRGIQELCDLPGRDLWRFFFSCLAAYLWGIGYDLDSVSSFICPALSVCLVKFLQSPWIITFIHFLAMVPASNVPCSIPLIKTLRCHSALLEIKTSH